MTPEEAKALRDKAKPGPWYLNLRERDGICPEIDLHIGNKLALSADYELADAAPELAEIVAGLKREYALLVPVETGVPGKPVWKYFVRKHEDGAAIVTQYPTIARWFEEGDDLAIFARMNSIPTYRIARRLASKPEVVQP